MILGLSVLAAKSAIINKLKQVAETANSANDLRENDFNRIF